MMMQPGLRENCRVCTNARLKGARRIKAQPAMKDSSGRASARNLGTVGVPSAASNAPSDVKRFFSQGSRYAASGDRRIGRSDQALAKKCERMQSHAVMDFGDDSFRLAYRFQQGNALGVVLEPLRPDGVRVPKKKWHVRIGVTDPELARHTPFSRSDFQAVIDALKEWCIKNGVGNR